MLESTEKRKTYKIGSDDFCYFDRLGTFSISASSGKIVMPPENDESFSELTEEAVMYGLYNSADIFQDMLVVVDGSFLPEENREFDISPKFHQACIDFMEDMKFNYDSYFYKAVPTVLYANRTKRAFWSLNDEECKSILTNPHAIRLLVGRESSNDMAIINKILKGKTLGNISLQDVSLLRLVMKLLKFSDSRRKIDILHISEKNAKMRDIFFLDKIKQAALSR